MRWRGVSISAIILFFLGMVVWAFTYGPANRTFVIPNKAVSVQSAGELYKLWQSSGVHGRIAVIFSRHINQQVSGNSFPEMEYLDSAMRHGIVRTAYFIVPDRVWPDVVRENLRRAAIVAFKTTDNGFVLLHEGGRIHVMPLSKYIPEQEKEQALVVIEQDAWSQHEHFRINNYFRSGLLTADLVVRIGNATPLP